ncbi:hypothetical protein EPN18_07670 [bacterium]|nr:MAG: hypothetical protein EPN18_07670 [bacterium]
MSRSINVRINGFMERSTRNVVLAFLAVVFVCVSLCGYSTADIYRYENNGIVSFVDDMNKVPFEYRGKVVIIKKAPANEVAVSGVLPQVEKQGKGLTNVVSANKEDVGSTWGFASSRIVKVGLWIAAAITVVVIIIKIGAALGHKKLAGVIALAVSCGVFYYLISTQLNMAAETYKKISGQVAEINKEIKKKDDAAEKIFTETDLATEGRQQTGASPEPAHMQGFKIGR